MAYSIFSPKLQYPWRLRRYRGAGGRNRFRPPGFEYLAGPTLSLRALPTSFGRQIAGCDCAAAACCVMSVSYSPLTLPTNLRVCI